MFKKRIILFLFAIFCIPSNLFSMHIVEGFLPPFWSFFWALIALPFVGLGLFFINKKIKLNPKIKIIFAMCAAFVFVLSALKLPSVTGSSSHPTGIGLGSVLFGPFAMSVIGVIVLLFQALLLAHGGLTTLGANLFSMGITGAFVAFVIFNLKFNKSISIFLASMLGDLATYIVTAFQLALAFPDANQGILFSFVKFISVFAITQVPIAISEGILTVIIFNVILNYNKEELKLLSVIRT